jgi:hypothetical protein
VILSLSLSFLCISSKWGHPSPPFHITSQLCLMFAIDYIYIYIPQQWVSVQVFVGVGHPYSQSTEKMLQLIVLCKPGDSSAVVFYAFQGYVYLKKKYWFYQYSLEPVSSKCNCWYTKFWWRCKRSNIVLRGGWIFDQISLMKPIDRFIRATKE